MQTDCAFCVAYLLVLTVRLQKSPYNLGQLPAYLSQELKQLNSNEECTCKKFQHTPQAFAIFISDMKTLQGKQSLLMAMHVLSLIDQC